MSLKFEIPVKTVNPLNGSQGRSRGAALGKARLRKKQRAAARLCAMAAYGTTLITDDGSRALVLLTRVSAGTLDGDNLQAALKGVRDGLADFLRVDDGSDRVVWTYAQKKCKRGHFSVEVEIGSAP